MRSPYREVSAGERHLDGARVKSPRSSSPTFRYGKVGGCVFRVKERRMTVRQSGRESGKKSGTAGNFARLFAIFERWVLCVLRSSFDGRFFVFYNKNG